MSFNIQSLYLNASRSAFPATMMSPGATPGVPLALVPLVLLLYDPGGVGVMLLLKMSMEEEEEEGVVGGTVKG